MNKITIYNSLSRSKEDFIPKFSNEVKMYCCGFTVYDHTHLGHIKKYIGDDIIRRVLEFNGYKVIHVQNVTDVGHLVSDGDEGEDKMEKGARKYGMTVWEIAKKYENEFFDSMDQVNVLRPNIVERAASDKSIAEQIENIKKLIDTEFAYVADSAVYFDVAKLPSYNPFSSQSLEDKITGAREDVVSDPQKRHQADFALWVFTKGDHANHVLRWDSPWGNGFPGWHIECSTISMANLGEYIDIHTGGLDHQYVHHPNEIAQNFGLTGHEVVKYWMHHNFLVVDGKKMSKSLGNFYTIEDVKQKGFNPMALRYLILGAHYRQQMNFTWDSMQAAQNAYDQLLQKVGLLFSANSEIDTSNNYYVEFLNSVNDDFNTPKSIGILWDMLRDSNLSLAQKSSLVSAFDKVLGLKLIENAAHISKPEVAETELPSEIRILVNQRKEARLQKNWQESDRLRVEIESLGYQLKDTPDGVQITKN